MDRKIWHIYIHTYTHTHTYMLSTRDPPQHKRFTQAESETMDIIHIPCKWRPKKKERKSQGSNTFIQKTIDFKTKAVTETKKVTT